MQVHKVDHVTHAVEQDLALLTEGVVVLNGCARLDGEPRTCGA